MLYCTQSLSEKGHSKRKEFASKGNIVFPFNADPYQKGDKNNLKELAPMKVYLFTLNSGLGHNCKTYLHHN